MKPEDQKLKDRILEALIQQFPGNIPTIIDISAESFRYQLERNGNYAYYLIAYNVDPSGNLKVDWKTAEQFML
jgi:hypothetical protein